MEQLMPKEQLYLYGDNKLAVIELSEPRVPEKEYYQTFLQT